LKYFPFLTKEKYTRYFGSWRFKDPRSKNTPHTSWRNIMPWWCYIQYLLLCGSMIFVHQK